MRINIPASIEDATEHLNGLDSLLRAKGWERSAIVAAFVRLHDGPGRPPETGTSTNFSVPRFAALGIAGLTAERTVRTYVERWLEANDGVYPEPGERVELPDTGWPPTRTGTNGGNSTAGMENRLDEMVEQHGVEAVADAVERVAARPSGTGARPRPRPTPADEADSSDDEVRSVVGDDGADSLAYTRAVGLIASAREKVRSASAHLANTTMTDDRLADFGRQIADLRDSIDAIMAQAQGAPDTVPAEWGEQAND